MKKVNIDFMDSLNPLSESEKEIATKILGHVNGMDLLSAKKVILTSLKIVEASATVSLDSID